MEKVKKIQDPHGLFFFLSVLRLRKANTKYCKKKNLKVTYQQDQLQIRVDTMLKEMGRCFSFIL